MSHAKAPQRTSFATAGIIAALAVNCALLAGVMLSLEKRGQPAPRAPVSRVLPKSVMLPPPPSANASPAATDAPRAGMSGGTADASAESTTKPEREQSAQAAQTAETMTGTIGRTDSPASNVAPLPRNAAGDAGSETARRAVAPSTTGILPPVAPSRSEAAATRAVPSAPGLPDLSSAAALPSIAPPAYTPVAASAAPAAAMGGGRVFDDESTVLAGLLRQYESVYQRRDAAGAATLWPTVDLRALTRAFARLRMQNLEFGDCTFAVAHTEATARCVGVLRYAQRIGDPSIQTEHHVWTVEFVRGGESWKIARITAQ